MTPRLADEKRILGHRHLWNDNKLFRFGPAILRLTRRRVRHGMSTLLPMEPERAVVLPVGDHARENTHESGLPSAVLTDDGDNLPAVGFKQTVGQPGYIRVALGDTFDRQQQGDGAPLEERVCTMDSAMGVGRPGNVLVRGGEIDPLVLDRDELGQCCLWSPRTEAIKSPRHILLADLQRRLARRRPAVDLGMCSLSGLRCHVLRIAPCTNSCSCCLPQSPGRLRGRRPRHRWNTLPEKATAPLRTSNAESEKPS